MVGNYLANHWIVSTKKNETIIFRGLESSQWNEGIIPAGEGIGLLVLIKKINTAIHNMNQGEICVYNDNKKLLKAINKKVKKESDCTQEAKRNVQS